MGCRMPMPYVLVALVLAFAAQQAAASYALRGITPRRLLQQTVNDVGLTEPLAIPPALQFLEGQSRTCQTTSYGSPVVLRIDMFEKVMKTQLGGLKAGAKPEPPGQIGRYTGRINDYTVRFTGNYCDIFQTVRTEIVMTFGCGTGEKMQCNEVSTCVYSVTFNSPRLC